MKQKQNKWKHFKVGGINYKSRSLCVDSYLKEFHENYDGWYLYNLNTRLQKEVMFDEKGREKYLADIQINSRKRTKATYDPKTTPINRMHHR